MEESNVKTMSLKGKKEEKKTIEEWEEELKIEILDPDGFDRKDPNLYNKKFTEEEFREKMVYSTIKVKWDSPIRKEIENG